MIISRRLLFCCFLGLGLVTGLFLGTLSQAIAAPTAASGQQNTLFVLVDDLAAEHPTLQGIWLAVRAEGSREWSWMPIYPTVLDESKNQYATPHSAFYLPAGEIEDVNALPPLRAQGAWWNEVFWLDEAALAVVQTISGGEAIAMADTWLEPQRALFEQVQILKNVCSGGQSAAANGLPALDQLLALMPNHFRSSINPFDLITRWDDWAADGFAASCTHPWARN